MNNRLLNRRQCVLEVLHPTRPSVSKIKLLNLLAILFKMDRRRIVIFGLRTPFGGGRSTGYLLLYDDEASQKRFEPKHRLIESELMIKVEKDVGARLRKHAKNYAKRMHATQKVRGPHFRLSS